MAMTEEERHQKEIYDVANACVDEVILEATQQVQARKESAVDPSDGLSGLAAGILKRGTRWQNRARTVVTRILTQLRICK
ncbi:uncharacterized protein LOC106663859 [Cimex lectularius]|uniref:Uncharacterized protein n=1 Tax=Cimex lectularius TaxID=79782 RepID=A0A8I6TCR6_CIMLE|nr:uncharacterized protein LOC106663859 [Cimex lectularius]